MTKKVATHESPTQQKVHAKQDRVLRKDGPHPRGVREIRAALKVAQAKLDEFLHVTSKGLWREAMQKDQKAAEARGEVFHLGKTGPALQAFEKYADTTEHIMRSRIYVLRWALGEQEEWF